MGKFSGRSIGLSGWIISRQTLGINVPPMMIIWQSHKNSLLIRNSPIADKIIQSSYQHVKTSRIQTYGHSRPIMIRGGSATTQQDVKIVIGRWTGKKVFDSPASTVRHRTQWYVVGCSKDFTSLKWVVIN